MLLLTLVFDKNSWHYKLVVYVFGVDFFLETDGFDIQAMSTVNMEKDFKIIYKKKPRTVNLCPYCRAIVGALIMFAFIVLWRLFPHKEKKLTHAQIIKRSQRNTRIVRGLVCGFMGVMGIWKFIEGEYGMVVFYGAMVIFNIYSVQILKWIAKNLPKNKLKRQTPQKPKVPSKLAQSISEKHDIVCPPVFFIDKGDMENLV